MPPFNIFQRVSQAPTNPKANTRPRQFDVADLYQGPVQTELDKEKPQIPLDEKLRQAYFWIVNSAAASVVPKNAFNQRNTLSSSGG